MKRITRDAKLALMFFAQAADREGTQPRSCWANWPGVLHIGFRHQNDKLISTVTGLPHRTPALGLQNLPDALQNEVAFEVPVKSFTIEAVEVHEHQRKSATGAGGPFHSRQRFMKKRCVLTR